MTQRKKNVAIAASESEVKQDDRNNSMFVMLMGWFLRKWKTKKLKQKKLMGKCQGRGGRGKRPRTPWLMQLNANHCWWARGLPTEGPGRLEEDHQCGATEAKRGNAFRQERGVYYWEEVRNDKAREGSGFYSREIFGILTDIISWTIMRRVSFTLNSEWELSIISDGR